MEGSGNGIFMVKRGSDERLLVIFCEYAPERDEFSRRWREQCIHYLWSLVQYQFGAY